MKHAKPFFLSFFLFFLPLFTHSDTWLGKAWRFVTAPVRPVWGDYRPPYRNYQAPLALFRRGSFEADRQQIIEQIKINGSDFRLTYELLYNAALLPTPGWGSDKEAVTPNAAYAKNCAFVYVMGVDADGDPLSVADRDAFAVKAMNVLGHFSDVTDTKWFFSNFNGGSASFWNDINQYRSMDLVNYCVAYELMRTGGKSVADLHTPRKQVKKYATDMFREADRPFSTLSGLMNNNLVEMVSAALVMSAIVCHEEGDYFWNYNRQPKTWINVGMARIQESEFSSLVHTQSEFNQMAGHREGPGYYAYAMEVMLPMFVAYNNFVGEDPNRTEYFTDNGALMKVVGLLGNLVGEPVPNPLHSVSWNNTFTWFNQIRMPNGCAPTYDDTKVDAGLNIMAVTRHPGFLVAGQQLLRNFNNKYDDRADFLAANYQPLRTATMMQPGPSIWLSPQSGNAVMKGSSVGRNNQVQTHYLHALAEPQFSKPLDFLLTTVNTKWGHEHSDAGSFSVCAGDEQLLIDPPYMGYNSRDLVRLGNVHNVVTVDGEGPGLLSEALMGKQHFYQQNRPVKTAINSFALATTYENCKVRRSFKMYNTAGIHPYYEINDQAASLLGHNRYFRLNLNGNGTREGDSSCDDSRLAGNHTVIWDYPCKAGRNSWGIMAKVNVTAPGYTPIYRVTDGHVHGNALFNPQTTSEGNVIGSKLDKQGDFNKGYHSRMEVEVTARSAQFQTLLLPLTCENIDNMRSGNMPYPAMRTLAGSNYNYLVLDSLGADNLCNLHLAQGSTDTITVPDAFLYGAFDFSLRSAATHTFLSYSHNPVLKNRGCVSNTGFRAVSMENGYFVSMNDTTIIHAEDTSTISYELSGKFKYSGSFTASDSTRASTSVTLFMPDLEINHPMVARDAETMKLLDFEHNEQLNYKFITVTFNKPSAGFILELADPCLMSCFFPSTIATIDTFFDFNEGTTETLGHNLDIVKDSGWLNISSGSKMSICPGYYLFNRDSITLASFEKMDQAYPVYSEYGDLPGGGSGTTNPEYNKRFGSRRSMIIVNNGAALILDSGSYTHVGVGSTVLIRRGGTLHIKPGATLEIGSNSMSDYGELIAEAGAFICIEDSSDLHFYASVKDTNNKNIFFIPVDAGVNERVNLGGINGNFAPGGRFGGPKDCIPLCSLWQRLPVDGVNNPEFGNNSVGKPYAFFSNVPDTVCSADTIMILNALRSRNEAKYSITVTRDGLEEVHAGRSQAYNYQALTASEPVNIAALGTGPGTLRFQLMVKNVCGDSDVYTQKMFIAQNPSAMFALSKDTICQGIGSLRVNGSASRNGTGDSIRHRWSVVLIDTAVYAPTDTNRIEYGGDWEYTARAVSDTFNFPGFKWLEGFRYAVGLTVFGRCSEAQHWDTVAVPLQVWVTANGLKTSTPLLGLMGVGLKGVIFSPYDSFTWQPKNKLIMPHTLTPVTQSTDTATRYVLSAYRKGCVARDTIRITYRKYVNLRNDTVLCRGNQLYVGNRFDAGILMGVLSTFSFTYSNQFLLREIGAPNFKKNFSLFLYYNDYQYYKKMFYCSESLMSYLLTNSEQFYNARDYPTLYGYYFNNDLNTYFQYFNMFLQANPALKKQVDSLRMSINQTDLTRCINTMMADYDYYNKNAVRTTWYRNGVLVPALNDWLGLIDRPVKPVEYRMLMVNGSTVEYDVIKLTPDSGISPLFGIISQRDSTVQFANYTQGNALAYVWDFGDGQSSTSLNPQHRFRTFNRTYRVCLKATNSCGSFVYCDWVDVDSNTLQILGLGKKDDALHQSGIKPVEVEPETPLALSGRNVLGVNKPNPFGTSTTIDYELVPQYKEASLHITNMLGQTVQRISIPVVKGTVLLQRDKLGAGLYYYSLVVDGVVADTKLMMIE